MTAQDKKERRQMRQQLYAEAKKTVSLDPTVLLSAGLDAAIAADFSLVPEITMVLSENADENCLVWIVANNPSREVRDQIFEKQLSLIEGFPEIEFDFNIISSPNKTPHEVATNAKTIYSRETIEPRTIYTVFTAI